MNLASALAELGDRLGIGVIKLDQNGGCLLAFDDKLVVDIEQATDTPGFHLTATVGPVPGHEREAVFAELLEANLQGRGTGSACLALDADLDEIVLSRSIYRADIDVDYLEQELDAFLTLLEYWQQRSEAGEIGRLRGTVAADTTPIPPLGRGIIRG